MKKLIAMMAAVCALGAYAADTWSGAEKVNFNSEEVGAWTVPEEGWTQDGTPEDFDLQIVEKEAGNNFLQVETPKDGSLAKTINAEQTGYNVWVDAKVKFTPFDQAPAIDGDAKIAVWYLAQDAEEGVTEGQTNLMVTAGILNGAGNVTQTNIALNVENFDPSVWHQLTIESQGSIVKPEAVEQSYPNRLGFTIALDGEKVAAKESFITAGGLYLTDAAKELGTKLFPSLGTDLVVSALALQGSGAIDDITIDATEVIVEVPLTLPESDFWVATSAAEKGVPGASVDLTLTAKDGYRFADGETTAIVTGTIGTDGTVTIAEEPETEAAVAMIGEDYFFTLEEAFAAIPEETEETELDIIADCQYGEDGFELKADDILVVIGTIAVDKDGIKLMNEETTLYVEGEFDLVTSGVDGFEAKYDEGESTWKLEPSEKPVLPTAKVAPLDPLPEGYAVAVQFDADDIGAGYDNWIAKFYLTSDVTIGEGEIQLGGQYDAFSAEWIDKDFTCEKDVPQSVLAVVGLEDDITVKTVFEGIQSFKCGVKNVALKNDATFSLKLVITDPEGVKEDIEICSIGELKVEKKAEENPWEEAEANIPDVTPENKTEVEATLAAIQTALGTDKTAADVGAWIKTVYGDNTAVPAATVAAAKNVDISVKYNLQLMKAETPTIEIKQAVDAEEKPIEGFTFQIKDGDDPVSLAAAVDKIQSMVQFTADLKTAFGASDAKDVTVGLSEDKKTATATFTKATAAGFMKVELK